MTERGLPTRPIALIILYWGTSRTTGGITISGNMSRKSSSRPRNRNFAKAKAASAPSAVAATTELIEITALLRKRRPTLRPVTASL
jgi:hypothetical protein